MLTSLLVLLSTMCGVQDPGAPRPDASAPATDAAAAAPEQTSENVRAYLVEAESQLYDPQAAGLKSVEFDAPVQLPGVGAIGTVHVSWNAGSDATTKFTPAENAELPPGLPPGMLAQQGDQVGHQLLDSMLNRPITPLLKKSVATMEPPQDGLVKVSFTSDAAKSQGIKEQAFFFDDDGLLQKSTMVLDMAASGMPGMTVPVSQDYSWKPVTTGSDLLVADSMSAEADLGIMGKQKSRISFAHSTIENVVLVTGMTTSSEAPAGMGGGSMTIEAQNLVVNGKPAPATPAPPVGG